LIKQQRDNENRITLKPNYNTLNSVIEFKNNYIIDFRISYSIAEAIGFNSEMLLKKMEYILVKIQLILRIQIAFRFIAV